MNEANSDAGVSKWIKTPMRGDTEGYLRTRVHSLEVNTSNEGVQGQSKLPMHANTARLSGISVSRRRDRSGAVSKVIRG